MQLQYSKLTRRYESNQQDYPSFFQIFVFIPDFAVQNLRLETNRFSDFRTES